MELFAEKAGDGPTIFVGEVEPWLSFLKLTFALLKILHS